MSKKSKNVALFFSGGLDSTYLMWKNLMDGNTVYPYYIDLVNNENKRRIEKQNTVLLCEEFKRDFKYYQVKNLEIISEINMYRRGDTIFSQVPIWIMNLCFIEFGNIDEIHIGYIGKDDAVPYVNDIKKSFDSFKWMYRKRNKFPKLKFPLLKELKELIVQELPEKYRRHIMSCENPEILPFKAKVTDDNLKYKLKSNHILQYKPCGFCVPCQRILDSNTLYDSFKFRYTESRINKLKSVKYELEREERMHKLTNSVTDMCSDADGTQVKSLSGV